MCRNLGQSFLWSVKHRSFNSAALKGIDCSSRAVEGHLERAIIPLFVIVK